MTWVPSGNAKEPLGPQGREAARRPDRRLLGTTRAGVGPAPSQNIIRAQIIIISGGTVTGLFEYSGAPAAGNPPVAYASAPGTTTDPFGNPLPWTAGGFVVVSGTTFAVLATASLQFHMTGDIANPLVSEAAGAVLNLSSGQAGTALNECILTLAPSATIPFATLQGLLSISEWLKLVTGAAPAAVSGAALLFTDAAGFLRTLPDSASSDTTSYNIGHTTRFSTTDQLVNSVTFVNTCGTAPTVGSGTYRVRAVLMCQQGPNVVPNDYRLGFTGTISQVRMDASFNSTTAGGQLVFTDTTTSNNGLLATPSFGANAIYKAWFDGVIVTTSSGTLAIQAANDATGDTFTVLALSFFHLEPIN